jgi:hypothetical protein
MFEESRINEELKMITTANTTTRGTKEFFSPAHKCTGWREHQFLNL